MLVCYELRSPLQLIRRPLATLWWTLFGHKSALFIRHQHEQRQIALRCLLLTFYCSIFGVCVVKWRPRRAADQLAEVTVGGFGHLLPRNQSQLTGNLDADLFTHMQSVGRENWFTQRRIHLMRPW